MKVTLLSATALRSALFASFAFGAVGAAAQTTPAPAAPGAGQKEECSPASPAFDPNTGNCVQPAEGTPGETAPGTNPGTAPADEEVDAASQTGTVAGRDQDEIVVTGSRIPRPQFEGTIPGAQVTQEQIQTRAFNSAIEALNDIPLVGPGASPFGTNGGQPGSLGAAFVDLLDLGTNRTLTLVNGRRFVSGNQGTLFVSGNTTGSQVDLNVIPTALVSRFDVLTVGGAAAYGSDAVAGVVNAILVDDYDGFQIGGIGGLTGREDAGNYRLTAIAGRNFLGDRANVTASYERVYDDGLTADRRNQFLLNPIAPTNAFNGSVRNPEFVARFGISTNAGTGAFLPTFSDEVAGNVATQDGIFGGTLLVSPGGSLFAAPSTASALPQGPFVPTQSGTTLATSSPSVGGSVAGNNQLVPGTPVAATLANCNVANLTTFCSFAPTGLPGSGTAQNTFANAVIAKFAPTLAGTGTQTDRNALAVQLLQANLPTPREFFAANPNVDPNEFFGRFVNFQQFTTTPAFLTIANTDPLTAGALPRQAVPLRFDDDGNLVTNTTCIDPATPGTAGGAPCATGFQNPAFFNVLRTEQTRDIGNLFAHFDVTDNITVYTENLFARVKTTSPQNTVPSSNAIANTTTENAVLVMSIDNPFLDAADRATLIAAGVPATGGKFLLSRTNQDLAPGGDNPITNNSDTLRLVGGVKGDFGLFGRNQTFDTSVTYGRNDSSYRRLGVLDVEYALAVNAVRDPVSGQVRCQAQVDRNAALGTRGLPRGIQSVDVIRTVGPDGIITETLVTRTATDEQIAQCVPFNPFGFGQSSEAARDYVTADTEFKNTNKQLFAQASLGGSLFDLPGGSLGYALSGDYRKDEIDFTVDREVSALGRTRSAVIANTAGMVQNYEFGAEARIPIFGEGFNYPLARNLDFTPAIRFVKQTGNAPDVRRLNGDIDKNEVNTGWNRIYSLAGSWRPVRDFALRGNVTRSLRQPSVVELFLGGQPAFNAYTDPCDNRFIGGGLNPDVRRANCRAAVIGAGLATNDSEADTFLASFVNPGNSVTGSFNGSPDLKPERGRSFTVGGALNPSFVPGLRLAADYIDVKLLDQIIPTTLTRALQVCYDEASFPDTSGAVGVNVCTFFRRNTAANAPDPAFILQNNFTSGFINLGALQVNALNMTGSFDVPLADWFGSSYGKLSLYANAYHLIHYKSSSNGDLKNKTTTFDFAGDVNRPTWEVQGRARYEHPSGLFASWTTNWQNKTCAIGAADVCATVEEYDLLKVPSFAIHDAAIGYNFGANKKYRLQFNVSNVFDTEFAVPAAQAIGLAVGGITDTFGRRFRVSTTAKF